MNLVDTQTNSGAIVVEGGVSVALLAFLHSVLNIMVPFVCVALVLILTDLVFGIGAATKRGERVRFSRALRRTLSKTLEYACWVIISASLAVAFNFEPLNWILLSFVIGIELISVITNWLTIRGKKIYGLNDFFLKFLKDKTGHDTSMIQIEDDPSVSKD